MEQPMYSYLADVILKEAVLCETPRSFTFPRIALEYDVPLSEGMKIYVRDEIKKELYPLGTVMELKPCASVPGHDGKSPFTFIKVNKKVSSHQDFDKTLKELEKIAAKYYV